MTRKHQFKIHSKLKDLDVRNNPSLVMPPKPQEQQKEDEMSYTSQLRRLGQLPDEKPENTIQKKYERRIRLRKIREATSTSEKDGEGATKLGCPKFGFTLAYPRYWNVRTSLE